MSAARLSPLPPPAQGMISRDEFRSGVLELGFMHCIPTELEQLFDVFDADGSGDISFRELNKMLRKSAFSYMRAIPGGATSADAINSAELVDVATLREQAKQMALNMSVSAELHLMTMIDPLSGEPRGGRLGTLPSRP